MRAGFTPLLAAALLAAAPWAAGVTAAGRATAGAWAGSPDTGTPLPGCFFTVDSSSQPLLGQTCFVPGGGSATAHNHAYAQAPSAFDPAHPGAYQLARLGTTSQLAVEVLSFAGSGRGINDPALALTAQTTARFTDYLLLGAVRPHSLVLSFHLSGELRAGAALAGILNPLQADNFYSVSATAGQISPFDGSFGATDPYAYGSVQVHRQLRLAGGATTVERWLDSHPGAALAHNEAANASGGTDVQLTLGPAFFSNPANDTLLLDITLVSSAYGAAWNFQNLPFGTVLTGNEIAADFGSTFAMTGLQALDAAGNDITAEALLGLQSLQPVPEPAAGLLMLAGLAWLRRRAGRR